MTRTRYLFARSLAIALTLLSVLWMAPNALAQSQKSKAKKQDSTKALDQKINKLIQQLGARSYASREKAKSALERMGLLAFDALNAAQDNPDIEIAMRARYLVRRLRVTWSRDNDSAEIKRILAGYSSLNPSFRISRMNRLALLTERQGTLALCRLCRFETNDRLSKTAALLVVKQTANTDPKVRKKTAQKIRVAMGRSKRPAADWLRTYSRWLDKGPSTLKDWEQIATTERQVLARYPERSSRLIARDLYRWVAEQLLQAKQEQRAIAMMRNTIQLLDGTQPQLLEITDWLMKRKAYKLIDEIVQRYQARFDTDRDLLYRLAEVYLQRNDSTKADQLALKASQTKVRPSEHIRAGYVLQERGMFRWAEREYRQTLKIQSVKSGSRYDQQARNLLSEMLHDLKREKDAADVLLPVVTKIQNDKSIRQIAISMGRHPGLASRMHYFYSLHYKQQKNNAKQIEHFKKGIKDDPRDPDLLIAMYRFKGGDAAYRKEMMGHLNKAIAHFKGRVKDLEEEYQETNAGPDRTSVLRDLALNNNQYAWLVSNTKGDYKDAVRCSHRSLELRPNTPGYLDTLGRCYYAVKDYRNAVKFQSRAVKLDPHSQQIRRQLKIFKEALEKSQQK